MTKSYPFQHKEAPVSKIGVVFADLLIPGRGEPVKDGALVYESKTILFAGLQKHLPAKYTHLQHASVPVLMPGKQRFSAVSFCQCAMVSASLVDVVLMIYRNVGLSHSLYGRQHL